MPDDNFTTNQPMQTPTAMTPPPMTDPATTSTAPAAPAVSSVVVDPTVAAPASAPITPEIYPEITSKISEAHNVLIALSSDPSVDEMAAAIGLSLYLDKLGKRATAIYSGATPNALEFLKPEETFEPSADTLQDFVIALNKEKADHLRYKLDGDYVKIYITPYKTRISESDLDFSYGDYNVDLVIALDVANGIDLDSALREHGRIMHDAVIINVTTGNPGKFGEIEWSDKKSSSVSEMIAKLLYSVKSDVEISKEEATAFLTGIVAATNRFSNASTTPETMTIASRLMESGANQQLISKNITPDIDNQLYSILGGNQPSNKNTDPTKLDIEHEGEPKVDETKEVEATVTEKESTLLDDLKAAEASLSQAGAETTPDLSNQPVRIGGSSEAPASEPPKTPEMPEVSEPSTEATEVSTPELPPVEPIPEPTTTEPVAPESIMPEPVAAEPIAPEPVNKSEPEPESTTTLEPELPQVALEDEPASETTPPSEKVITPPADMDLTSNDSNSGKYGKMLEDALNSINSNPAAASAPEVASTPEINGVPEMNYMPMPGDEVLPPPPTPPIDMNSNPEEPIPAAPIAPAEPAASTTPETNTPEPAPTSLGPQPAMQDQVYVPQASDPSAFKIPGM